MYTSHQLACLFRCRPWPGTLQHNGSSEVYSHLSSSNWVFLSPLVFHSVIYSYFHPLLSLSLSLSLSPALSFHIFFLSHFDIRHFSTCGARKLLLPGSLLLPLVLPPNPSPLFCAYISRDMEGNRSRSSLYTRILSPSVTCPFTVAC